MGTYVRSLGSIFAAELASPPSRLWMPLAGVVAAFSLVALTSALITAVLGLVAVVGVVIGYARPHLIGPLVVVLLPAGKGAETLGADVAPLEAVVGGAAMGYLAGLAARRESSKMRAADWVFFAFVAFVALSALGPVDDSDRFRQFLFWAALGVVFHAVGTNLDRPRARTYLLLAFLFATLFEATYALAEYLGAWSERFSLRSGAIVYPLPEGTLNHSNALAQFLVLAVLAVLAFALAERGTLRTLGLVAATAGSLALVVTFSRASWIAFAAGCAVYLLDGRTRRAVVVASALAASFAAGLALTGAGAIGARVSSLFDPDAGSMYDFRLELIRRGISAAAEHPLAGVADFVEVGVYAGRLSGASHPHNLLVGIAVFFGIPAALAFGALVIVALRAAWRGFRGRTAADLTALGFLGVLVALLVNGLLEYPFWNPTLMALVVLVLAVSVALGIERSEASREIPSDL